MYCFYFYDGLGSFATIKEIQEAKNITDLRKTRIYKVLTKNLLLYKSWIDQKDWEFYLFKLTMKVKISNLFFYKSLFQRKSSAMTKTKKKFKLNFRK